MKNSVAFFENGSWYHRTKILNNDYTVKYGKKGGFKRFRNSDSKWDRHGTSGTNANPVYDSRRECHTWKRDYEKQGAVGYGESK